MVATGSPMNGAESLVHTLLASGIDTCFANPGTSEMHFVAALDRIPGMRCVLGLFEGVVTGAADGYARIAGRPAATLLHCGPGLANGLANLHNGRRAQTMMVNCVGDQATHHRPLDAPLTADTEGLARAVSGWVRTVARAEDVGRDAAVAAQMAQTSPGQIATLILPSDTCWNPGGVVAPPLPVPPAPTASPHAVKVAARLLRDAHNALLVVGGHALRADTLAEAARVCAATGATMLSPFHTGRIERGRGRHPINTIPYPVDHAVAALAEFDTVVLVGTTAPVIFFAYPGKPGSPVRPGATVHALSRPEHDQLHALAALTDELGSPPPVAPPAHEPTTELGAGPITSEAVAQTLTALLPDQAIVVNESVTFGRAFLRSTHAAAPHDWLSVPGGAIGGGMPLSIGAAIAAPGRRVVDLQADGSSMYTIQSLWTQARERLDVTTVVFNNRKYQILLGELAQVGAHPGRTALDMMDLGNPDIDFVRLAGGMGVEAARATTMEQFNDLFAHSLTRSGPFLIDLATG